MKTQTGVNRNLLTIPQRGVRSISGRKADAKEEDMETRPRQPLAATSLVQRSFAPLVKSPGSIYVTGVGLGIGCGVLVVLLLGALSL